MKIELIREASKILRSIVVKTPLQLNQNISEYHNANVFLKREDLQTVRSYKIRGAYHKIFSLSPSDRLLGVVCASAGNHAQGVAYTCNLLGIKGVIFMPITTPQQKIERVAQFGNRMVEIKLFGDTFDQAYQKAIEYRDAHHSIFIHPFDDEKIIEGQATVALEILEQSPLPIDFLILPIGGGGLAAGVSSVFKQLSPHTQIIGIEPKGAASMQYAFKMGQPEALVQIERFVDGAAVQKVGQLNYSICKDRIDQLFAVDEGKVCSTLLKLYNNDGIIVEPAGALSVSVLDQIQSQIEGKNIVCIISGSNNDITRMEEIKERSLIYEGLKHYFIVRFAQRAGALKEFVTRVLGPTDDITFFEYSKKNNREKGAALIGIELQSAKDFAPLLARLEEHRISFEYINDKQDLFNFLI